MDKMSKSEFMSRYINDMYKRRYERRKIECDAENYTFDNIVKTQKRVRSFKNVKSR